MAGQDRVHARGKLLQLGLRAVHAKQGGKRALVLCLVLAGSLAQLLGTGLDIEDVVTHLERQAECIGEAVELGQLRFVGLTT
ncbi:hypothetical protein G6F60_014753 [Rhizopus arrhizus]|nr:hypothetical protein G6F60_014753 [Rhizopus arrhizus]